MTGAVTIDSCQIRDNGSVGISTGGGDAGGSHVFTFTGNIVSNNVGDGIQGLANGTQTISDNAVSGNSGNGIRTRGNGTYTISDNIISGNTGRGINAANTTHHITDNTISSNGGGIQISESGNYTITGNSITGNTAIEGSAFLSSSAWSPSIYSVNRGREQCSHRWLNGWVWRSIN